MTWTDPIVEEVRRARHDYAARFNFDLDAIFEDLKAKEAASGKTYVDRSRLEKPQKTPAQTRSKRS
jgi:hypothetical protein